MEVLIIDTVHPALKERLNALGFHTRNVEMLNRAEIFSLLGQAEGIIIRSRFPVDREFLDAAPNLKFIGRVGAGLENIDLTYAHSRKIKVINAPEGNRDAVGEHCLGMLLMLVNNLRQADSQVRQGLWNREDNRGIEVSGKTVGIIGYGRMGSAFAEKLQGFGVEIIAYDLERKNIELPYVRQGSLAEIWDKAQILSFHVPQTLETLYYFDEVFLAKMKQAFYLLNTSRGKVVKTSAVASGLKQGRILGAGLDVLEYEKSSFENLKVSEMPADFQYLLHSDKTVLSPHIAGWTVESNRKLAEIIVEKIAKYYSDELRN